MSDSNLGDMNIGSINGVDLSWQFLALWFLGVPFEDLLLESNDVAVHEVDLVLDQGGQDGHDVRVVKEQLVVGQGVQDLEEFWVGQEGLSGEGGWFELYCVGLGVVGLILVEKMVCDDL